MMEISNTPSGSGELVKSLSAQQDETSTETQNLRSSSKVYTMDRTFEVLRPSEQCEGAKHAFNTAAKLTRSPSASGHFAKSCRNFFRNSIFDRNRQSSNLVLLAVLLCLLSSLVTPSEARRSVGVCNGIPCANGGKLLVSNSIWGNCRCRCPSGFVGPYCQYQAARKRSVDITAADDARERAEILELIRQRLLRMSQRLREEMNVEVTNDDGQTVDEADMASPSNVNSNAIDDQEVSIQVNNRPRRSWLSTLYRL